MKRIPASFIFYSLMVMLFLYLPVVILIGLSFNASSMGVAWKGFTFQWYEKLVMDASILHAAGNSVIIAVVSTSLALLLGVGTAVGMETIQKMQMPWVNMVIVLPLVRNWADGSSLGIWYDNNRTYGLQSAADGGDHQSPSSKVGSFLGGRGPGSGRHLMEGVHPDHASVVAAGDLGSSSVELYRVAG